MTKQNLQLIAVRKSARMVLTCAGLLLATVSVLNAQENTQRVTKYADAKAAAVAAFKKHTKSKIKAYSVKTISETEKAFEFRFEATKEFRPGFHWHIEVEKATLKTTVTDGE